MFDIGGPELLFIILLGLLIFGPRRLPRIGRQVGAFVAQMRRSLQEVQGTIEREAALEEVRRAAEEVRRLGREAKGVAQDLAGVGPPPPADPTRRLRAARAAAGDEGAAGEDAGPAPGPGGTEEETP